MKAKLVNTIEAKPEKLIDNRASDTDKLDKELREPDVEMISPHRKNRTKTKTLDSHRLRRYEQRRIIEQFFAWIERPRRLLIPRDRMLSDLAAENHWNPTQTILK